MKPYVLLALTSLTRFLFSLNSLQAQWGERDDSDDSGSDNDHIVGDNFFEEESLDSNSSDSGDDGELIGSDHIYKRYFGARAWKSTIEKSEGTGTHSRQNSEASSKVIPDVGPSYDMLAPVVRVNHDYDETMLNYQSVTLARGWDLGGWEDPGGNASKELGYKDQDLEPISGTTNDSFLSTSQESAAKGLPHYRYLSQQPSFLPIARTKSDTNLTHHIMSKRSRVSLDEPGVHGGEYSIRPNMEESMTFLKKLFSHHQDGGGTFLPPDNPLSKYKYEIILSFFCYVRFSQKWNH